MTAYRVFQDGVSFGDRSHEADALETAIEMAKEFSRQKNGANFVVEKVEKVWEVKPRMTPTSNAIHASIRDERFDADCD